MAGRRQSGGTTGSKERDGGGRGPRDQQTQGVKTPQPITGESDENYNLISVLYHLLQGSETATRYIEDARQVGDDKLVEFLTEYRREQVERAMLAKQLLIERLSGEEEEEDDDDGEEDDEEEEDDD